MNALTSINIGDIAIRQTTANQYCINDLHKAAGALSKDQPSKFLLLDSTKELVDEINKDRNLVLEQNQAVKVINGGSQQGTYVAKELVYAYAMWISPKFSLQVIRAYDALVMSQPTTQTYQLEHLAALQAELLKANPRLQDVLNLTRLGYSQARIGEMLGLGSTAIYNAIKRLRACGFVVCADSARLPVLQGGAA